MTGTIKQIRRLERGTVVEAAGEVDLRTQPEFQEGLLSACAEKPQVPVVHLGQVVYMDSSGVGTPVKIAHELKGNGGTLVLVAPTERVRSIFEITTPDKYFTIVDTEEAAPGQ